jgi:hypothetical protein
VCSRRWRRIQDGSGDSPDRSSAPSLRPRSMVARIARCLRWRIEVPRSLSRSAVSTRAPRDHVQPRGKGGTSDREDTNDDQVREAQEVTWKTPCAPLQCLALSSRPGDRGSDRLRRSAQPACRRRIPPDATAPDAHTAHRIAGEPHGGEVWHQRLDPDRDIDGFARRCGTSVATSDFVSHLDASSDFRRERAGRAPSAVGWRYSDLQ